MPRRLPDAPTALGPDERSGVAAEVVDALQRSIRDGIYGPGERLPSERSLGEQLGVSRPTVREAIQALATMNILEVRRGSGVYVTPLAVADLLRPLRFAMELNHPTLASLFEVRMALEPLAAGLAADRATGDELDRLTACVVSAAPSRLSARRFVELDTELHHLIVVAAKNPLLENLIASLGFLSRQSRERTVRQAGVRAVARSDHQAIVSAIGSRSRARAEDAMRRHLEHVWRGSSTPE